MPMALTQRLQLRQSHALVMTPQLMQAIKLLQLSHFDLAAYVEGELERNPLLERAGEQETQPGDANSDSAGDAAPDKETAAPDWPGEATSRTDVEDRLGTGRDDLFA